jgi:hypothetical protein
VAQAHGFFHPCSVVARYRGEGQTVATSVGLGAPGLKWLHLAQPCPLGGNASGTPINVKLGILRFVVQDLKQGTGEHAAN